MKKTIALLLLMLLMMAVGCGDDDDDAARVDGDDDAPYIDDDYNDTGDDDDDDDDTLDDDTLDDDDDTVDDDDDDTAPPDDSTPSFNYGIVHFHYYGDLGGYNGQIFKDDQAWAAANVELGIIGYTDDPMRQTWEKILDNEPRGTWLRWQVAHLFQTFETAGTCADPQQGEPDQSFAENSALFTQFLADHPEHGDGESCYLHVRHDGVIQARWHAAECDVLINQTGYEDSAGGIMANARLHSLVWDEYSWLLNVSGQCARDYTAWKVLRQIEVDGFGGAGFDNLGGYLEDGYYLPEFVDAVDVMEIADDVENNITLLNTWYVGAIDDLLRHVAVTVNQTHPEARFVFNGGSYCNWDGAHAMLTQMAHANVGIWCENALQYPAWGNQDTADRLRNLTALSDELADAGGFLALETFYGNGSADPSPEEVLFYLAAHYVGKNDDDVLALKPDWNPYSPLAEVLWFDVFGVDLGAPVAAVDEQADGVFVRDYANETSGTQTRVIVRVDGDAAPIQYDLGGDFCRLEADSDLTPVSGTISLAVGDGLLLLADGVGGVSCDD